MFSETTMYDKLITIDNVIDTMISSTSSLLTNKI